jgi:hypothetical protein
MDYGDRLQGSAAAMGRTRANAPGIARGAKFN